MFDRGREDLGNVILLEHVNLRVPDMEMASAFYVHALGGTRDPYIDHGPDLVWFNLGFQQFHIPRAAVADVLRGKVHLVVPDLDDRERSLAAVAGHLAGTEFGFERDDSGIEIRGPWGNRFRCTTAGPSVQMGRGLAMVEFDVPAGSADGIARFYNQVLGARSVVDAGMCVVSVGHGQSLRFVESDGPLPDYDGHHLAIYVQDFSGPHGWLVDRELIVEESDQHQYRFNWIVDPASGERLFEVEHEVRSTRHPLYGRRLVNRNLAQRIPGYVPGADAA